MAYLFDPNQDDEQAAAPGQTGPETMVGGSGGLITGAGSGGQAPGQAGATDPNKATRSGAWTNLQNYLGANQGADARMGGQIRGKADQAAQGYEQAAGTLRTTATEKANAATVGDSGVVAGINNIGAGQGAQGLKAEDYEKQANAVYNGPKQATDLADEWQKSYQAAQKTQRYGQLANQGEAGTHTLLADAYAGDGKQYRKGEQALDGFILSGGQQGSQAIQGIAQDYGKFTDKTEGLATELGTQFKQAADTTAKTAADTKGAAEAARSALGGRFDKGMETAEQTNAREEAAYKALVKGDAKALKGMGYDDGTLEYLQSLGYDFSRTAQAGGGYGLGDFTTTEDVSGFQELAALLGETPGYDFAKGGKATGISSKQLTKAQEAAKLDGSLQARLKAKQAARQGEYEGLMSGLTGFGGDGYKQLGLSDEEYQMARDAGIDPSQFVTGGRKLALGDVLNDQDRSGYGALLKELGLSVDMKDAGDEGQAYSFNKGAWGEQMKGLYQKKLEADAAAKAAAGEAPAGSSSDGVTYTVPTPYGDITYTPGAHFGDYTAAGGGGGGGGGFIEQTRKRWGG